MSACDLLSWCGLYLPCIIPFFQLSVTLLVLSRRRVMFICCSIYGPAIFFCRLKRTVWKLNCVKETKSVKVHQGIKMRLCRNKRELKLVWIDFLPLFRIALTCWEPSAIYALLCVKTVTWLCQRMAKVNDVTYFYFSLIGESCHSFPTLAESFCVVALQTLFVNISHLFLWLSLLHCRPPWTLNFSFPAFPVRCSKSTDLLYNIINLVSLGTFFIHFTFIFLLKK